MRAPAVRDEGRGPEAGQPLTNASTFLAAAARANRASDTEATAMASSAGSAPVARPRRHTPPASQHLCLEVRPVRPHDGCLLLWGCRRLVALCGERRRVLLGHDDPRRQEQRRDEREQQVRVLFIRTSIVPSTATQYGPRQDIPLATQRGGIRVSHPASNEGQTHPSVAHATGECHKYARAVARAGVSRRTRRVPARGRRRGACERPHKPAGRPRLELVRRSRMAANPRTPSLDTGARIGVGFLAQKSQSGG